MASDIFFSYTRIKDDFDAIKEFHKHLENEVRQKVGNVSTSIFKDTNTEGAGIRFGEKFKDVLIKELAETKILVVFLSPTWCNSEWCRWEYQQYSSKRMSDGSERPIVVVLWDEVPEATLDEEGKKVFEELKQRHNFVWENLKHKQWQAEEKNIAISNLAKDIREHLLNVKGHSK